MSETPIAQQADAAVTRKQPMEWVQALAEVHAKFIEEATGALVKTASEAASDVPVTEKALQDMADFETKVAGNSQLDWLQAVARSHTKFVTDLTTMYANAIKNGLSG
jgi:hypothetical protein